MAKLYPKEFEDVFSTDRPKSAQRLVIDRVAIDGMSLDRYVEDFDHFLRQFYASQFDGCVRLSWLRRKFGYEGHKTILPMNKTPRRVNDAFVKFLRRHIGHDIQIMTRGTFFTKLEMYFEDLFPGFMDGNPFTNPEAYRFPFEFITLEYLIVVYDMDDRMAMLWDADKKKLAFARFQDYAINHAYSVNRELGRDRYIVKLNMNRDFPFCIRDSDKLQDK